jgi:uncharacterized membrane protein YGL010W
MAGVACRIIRRRQQKHPETAMDQTVQQAPLPTGAPRAIDTLLAKYSESHLNHTNEIIHVVCVPLIVFTLLGIVWWVHPLAALALSAAALCYYFQLSRPFFIGMLAMTAVMLAVLGAMPPATVLPLSIAIFVLAWIGQFIGHQIEGKKPSFLDDLRFLLIGPLFVLGFLYRRLNLSY